MAFTMSVENICFNVTSVALYVLIFADSVIATFACSSTRDTEIHETKIWNHMQGIAALGWMCTFINTLTIFGMVYRIPSNVSYKYSYMYAAFAFLFGISMLQLSMKSYYVSLPGDKYDLYYKINPRFMHIAKNFSYSLPWPNAVASLTASLICEQIYQEARIYVQI